MPYRCDFYSDEEYEYAVQMEMEEYREQEYREQLAYEEAFAEYCREEYEKELKGK